MKNKKAEKELVKQITNIIHRMADGEDLDHILRVNPDRMKGESFNNWVCRLAMYDVMKSLVFAVIAEVQKEELKV